MSYFLTAFKNSQEVKRLTWRAFSLAVAHEEEFSLAVAEKVGNGFWGSFVGAIPFNQIGF